MSSSLGCSMGETPKLTTTGIRRSGLGNGVRSTPRLGSTRSRRKVLSRRSRCNPAARGQRLECSLLRGSTTRMDDRTECMRRPEAHARGDAKQVGGSAPVDPVTWGGEHRAQARRALLSLRAPVRGQCGDAQSGEGGQAAEGRELRGEDAGVADAQARSLESPRRRDAQGEAGSGHPLDALAPCTAARGAVRSVSKTSMHGEGCRICGLRGKGGKTHIPLHPRDARLVTDYLEASGHGVKRTGRSTGR